MALTGALRILRLPGHALPYWTLRADLNAPCELSHISLIALACSAQWTGIYAFDAVAFMLARSVMVAARCVHDPSMAHL